ncbi:MAG: penicillin-binding protein 1A [Alphaproteobacteria bacterium]|nr:penicillin-binding protein 1A [Alphaproteobacteria bacterium]
MRILSILVSLFFFGCLIAFTAIFAVILTFSAGLPDYQQLEVYKPQITSRLYANDGSLLAEYANEKRVFVPVENIPPLLRQAFISAEDKNFYTHGGIDMTGLVRAVIVNIKNWGTGRRPVGASTITQQVAKNFLLTSEQKISRKIKEALLARRIEQAFTKDHILELYLNEIYLGVGSYGVAAAALNYFNKSMEELTLGEMAFLAALPKGPNNYHPIKRKPQATERRNWVLKRMLEDGVITKEDYLTACEENIQMVNRDERLLKNAGFYSEEVRRFVSSQYGDEAMYNGGLSIRTSLDPKLQNAATEALQSGLLAYDKRHGWRGAITTLDMTKDWHEAFKKMDLPPYTPDDWEYGVVLSVSDDVAKIQLQNDTIGNIYADDMKWAKQPLPEGKISKEPMHLLSTLHVGDVIFVQPKKKEKGTYLLQQMPKVEGALVAINPHTGRVLAMVGGFSFKKNQFNRAVQAKRQPGSSFKPFVYLAALDSGYTPSSLILDAPIVMELPDGSKWKPKNYSKVFYGPTTLRVGLEKSRNLMTIRLAQAIGIEKAISYGKKFGISDNLKPELSTALGSGETTPMKLTAAYAMLVNGGRKITPNLIDRIQDRDGKTIYKHDNRMCENCSGENASPDTLPTILDNAEQIQDPISAYQMVNILTGVVQRGTGSAARSLKRTLGAKSGTSNDSLDAWFVGFSPDLVVGVWVGFDVPTTLGPNDTGGAVSGPIFRDFMREALKNEPDIPFRVPEGVQLVRVNAQTGKPAKPGDNNIIVEAFRVGTQLDIEQKIIGEDITIHDDENTPDIGGLY